MLSWSLLASLRYVLLIFRLQQCLTWWLTAGPPFTLSTWEMIGWILHSVGDVVFTRERSLRAPRDVLFVFRSLLQQTAACPRRSCLHLAMSTSPSKVFASSSLTTLFSWIVRYVDCRDCKLYARPNDCMQDNYSETNMKNSNKDRKDVIIRCTREPKRISRSSTLRRIIYNMFIYLTFRVT